MTNQNKEYVETVEYKFSGIKDVLTRWLNILRRPDMLPEAYSEPSFPNAKTDKILNLNKFSNRQAYLKALSFRRLQEQVAMRRLDFFLDIATGMVVMAIVADITALAIIYF